MVDKTLPVGKGNVKVVSKVLQENLDMLMVDCKMGTQTLQTLCKNLGE